MPHNRSAAASAVTASVAAQDSGPSAGIGTRSRSSRDGGRAGRGAGLLDGTGARSSGGCSTVTAMPPIVGRTAVPPARRRTLPAVGGLHAGTLILAGAPIGDPGDVTPRLRAALPAAGAGATEGNRRLRRLAP